MSTFIRKRTTEESKNRAVDLWIAGYTSGEIAKQLCHTRAQVMGIIHRAKKKGIVMPRALPVEPKKEKKDAPVMARPAPKVFRFGENTSKKPQPPTKPKPEPVLPKDPTYKGPRNILNVKDGECRWVVSQGLFCARPVGEEHRSWCSDHYKIVYVKSDRRDKKLHAEMLMHKMKFNF
jgi:hypothetical protein